MKKQFLVAAAILLVACAACFAGGSVEQLILQLGAGKKDVNDAIVSHGPVAIKPLAKLLLDAKAPHLARIDAALLLAKIGGKNAVAPLKAALSDNRVQYFAVLALGDVGPAAVDAVPALAKLAQERAKDDRLSTGRRQLIETLGKIGGDSQEAVDALVLSMTYQRSYEAALALTKFRDAGAEALITLAAKYAKDDRSEKERRFGEAYLAVAWGSPTLPKEMIPVFAKHLEKGDFHTRDVASRALAGVGLPAIPVLSKHLDDQNPDIRAAAAEGLATMNWFAARDMKKGDKRRLPVAADDFFPKLKKLYKLPNGRIDQRIIHAMHGIDRDRFMADPELVRVLEDEFLKALRRQLEKKT